LRVAFGERLPLPADGLQIRGHAIEARVYAEDPSRDFLPAIGTLSHLVQPTEIPGQVRVDTGVRAGDTISPHYDPMIAKLIVWGEDRSIALRRLEAALAQYEVVGLRTNLGLLRAIAGHTAFAHAELDTGFIARHAAELMPAESAEISPQAWAAAVQSVLTEEREAAIAAAALTGDPHSPWADIDAWRMNGDGYQDIAVLAEGADKPVILRAHPKADGFDLDLPAGRVAVKAECGALSLDGVRRKLAVVRDGEAITVIEAGHGYAFTAFDVYAPPQRLSGGGGKVTAPVPGRVTRVHVTAGETVSRGQALLVIEAMKTEFTLTAPRDGVVAELRCKLDDMVADGAELVVLQAEDAA
jgi:3-methylcrotonyl-CoA carboxylase alpha subunit